MHAKAASFADRVRSADRERWPPNRRVLVESIVAAVCAYILSAAFEALLIIRSARPNGSSRG